MIHFNKEIIYFKNTRYLFEEENRERERVTFYKTIKSL